MERMNSKRALEFGLYVAILLGCITGLYWRFWYRPPVDPVVMVAPKTSPGMESLPKPMLDPDFRWELVRTDLASGTATFCEDATGRTLSIRSGEEIAGWQMKTVDRDTAVLVKSGEERAVYLQSPSK